LGTSLSCGQNSKKPKYTKRLNVREMFLLTGLSTAGRRWMLLRSFQKSI